MTTPDHIEKWRAALAAEVPDRTTSAFPPVTRQVQADNTVLTEQEPADSIGANLSASLIRYIGHPDGMGTQYLTKRSLDVFARFCRSKHARWPDHRSRPVCSEIAYAVIRDGTSLLWAANQNEVTYGRAERLLVDAVAQMREWQSRWLADNAGADDARHDRDHCVICRSADGLDEAV